MNKIMAISVCAIAALSVSVADAKQKKRDAAKQPVAAETSKPQALSNPYAGGGPSGANQATNSPKASNEIAGGM